MKVKEVVLELPLPPSPNERAAHPMAGHRAKNEYRRQVWTQACSQEKPFHDPPEHVLLTAHFFVHNERDEDNLTGSLKWALDALKQEQTGKLHWRDGIADQKGFFVDDDPKHLTVLKPTQAIDRDNPRLVLFVRWTEEESVA